MFGRRFHRLFVRSLLASVLVHAAVLAIVQSSMHSDQRGVVSRAEVLVMIAPPEIALGIDAANPPSPTWLGFADFEQQFAPQSEVEQAFFSPDVSIAPMALRDSGDDRASVIDQLIVQAKDIAADTSAKARPRTEAVDGLGQIVEMVRAASASNVTATPPIVELKHRPTPDQSQKAAASSSDVSPSSPAAVRADKESVASSTIEVPPENWRLGKPLAAQGLELKTRRPELTMLTMMTAMPADPLVEITFENDGVPRSVQIKESTGDKRVDDAFIACLYRWRAAGKRLAELSDGETLSIDLRLILTRRGAA